MSEFDKVVGYEGIKLELQRICDVVKYPEKYAKLGVRVPKGLMLEGEPGLGKTLMATCFINECGCKTYTIRKDKPDGDFVKHIKDTYDLARKEQMAIVFLDDIDKFANEDREHCDAEEYVAVQSCIDSCTDNNVFTIATANESYKLPDSLKRAGRFDKVIEIQQPKGSNARKIVKHFLKEKQVMKSLDIEEITRYLEDKSCAEIESLINEAGIYAGYAGREMINRKDILEAILRDRFGPSLGDEKDERIDIHEVAVHEVGHALVYEMLAPGNVNYISICSNGRKTKGITVYGNMYRISAKYEEERVTRALAGKAAVEVICGKTDVGCEEDISTAFRVAGQIIDDICAFEFGSFIRSDSGQFITNNKDKAICSFIEKKYNLAKQIILENRALFDAILEELLEKKTLTYKDIARIRQRVEGSKEEGICTIPLSA